MGEFNRGTDAYRFALLVDVGRGRIGIEFYVPDDKELGCKVIENVGEFERRLGAVSKPIDATKASGLRLYKGKYKIKDNEESWPEIIEEQMAWAKEMKSIATEMGL